MNHEDQSHPRYSPGPWVIVAAICERSLIDTDNRLSLIRISERFVLSTNDPTRLDLPRVPVSMAAIVVLSGSSDHDGGLFTMQINSPSGHFTRGRPVPLQFRDSGWSTRITVNLTFHFDVAGTYWIDAIFDDRVLTRIPLQVVFAVATETTMLDETECNEGEF